MVQMYSCPKAESAGYEQTVGFLFKFDYDAMLILELM